MNNINPAFRNHILEDEGPHRLSTLVTIWLYGGRTVLCRAFCSRLPESEAQLNSVLSDGGRQAWVSPLDFSDEKTIEFIVWPGGERCRVLDRDPKGSLIRLQVLEPAP